MKHTPFTLLIHIALAVILAGAIVTHFCGIQGELTLKTDDKPVNRFKSADTGQNAMLPFNITLKEADIDFYPGTTTPMDFHSTILIDNNPVHVSMNNVGKYEGWRFYQSGISPDSSTLSISYDPWGTGITYAGYLLLGIGMICFFFQKKTPWRALLKKRTAALLMLLFTTVGTVNADNTSLPCMQRPLAANLGKAYVYWNDRICPLQTMARDVASKLYDSTSYKGFSAEQILSGWLFYYDAWLKDFESEHEIPDDKIINADADNSRLPKEQREAMEQWALIRWLGTGEAFKIYPYKSAAGHMEWLSLTGRRPSQMSLEQWKFMQTTMADMQALLLQGQNIAANENINTLIEGQRKYAGEEVLPSPAKIQAERIYNSLARPICIAILSFILAASYLFVSIRDRQLPLRLKFLLSVGQWITLIYALCILSALWWISGHMPLSNGPETMMFMGLLSLLGAVCLKRPMLKGALHLIGGVTFAVAAIGASTPQIGALMPVLASPLLSVHVMLVMASYVLFLLMAVLSAVALFPSVANNREELCRINRIILTPAVFLLAAGIFVGAVWANQSWGRYWGWDPKETCALVTMLIYSLPLHWGSRHLRCFRCPRILHIYLLISVLSVLFTYFGANYLLPGLHSYA